MLSAVIPSTHSYPAVPLARQQVHQWCVHPGPLVLGTGPFNSPTPTEDRDQTVSRRFKPSSRTTLNGEQPYLPFAFALDGWFPISLREPLHASVTFWEATAPVKLPTRHCPLTGSRRRVRDLNKQGWYFNDGSLHTGVQSSQPPTYATHAGSNPNVKL